MIKKSLVLVGLLHPHLLDLLGTAQICWMLIPTTLFELGKSACASWLIWGALSPVVRSRQLIGVVSRSLG